MCVMHVLDFKTSSFPQMFSLIDQKKEIVDGQCFWIRLAIFWYQKIRFKYIYNTKSHFLLFNLWVQVKMNITYIPFQNGYVVIFF